MAQIRPFKALRPDSRVAHLVASVPYDVVSSEEAAREAGGNPLSFLRVTRSEIELPEGTQAYSEEVYEKARKNLERLIKEAPMLQEERAKFYVYRLTMGEQSQTGIAACFSVDDYDNDVIMKHEKTRKAKEDDRTNHIVASSAQTGAVFLTYRGRETIDSIVDKVKTSSPLYDFSGKDLVRHSLWAVPDEYERTIVEEFASVEHLYIADGHHRAASASRVREIKMKGNPDHRGDEEYNFFYAVIFPESQLKIMPYNRVILDAGKLSKSEILDRIKKNFDVEQTNLESPVEKRTFSMYLGKKWYLLKAKDSLTGGSLSESLDVSLLQNYLFEPIFGIENPRTDNRIDFIGGIRGTSELMRLVDSDRAKLAFSLVPVTLNDLMSISDAGEIMPPKSTWFEPKLRDGLLVHLI